jgi:hypothetical protein
LVGRGCCRGGCVWRRHGDDLADRSGGGEVALVPGNTRAWRRPRVGAAPAKMWAASAATPSAGVSRGGVAVREDVRGRREKPGGDD